MIIVGVRLTPIQRGFLLFALLAAIAMAASNFLLRSLVLSPQAYYDYHGTRGPYIAQVVNNECVFGKLQQTFKPGQYIGWQSDVTVQPGVAVERYYRIIEIHDGTLIGYRDFNRSSTGAVALATQPVCIKIDADAKQGTYQIIRRVVFYPERGQPVSTEFPAIHIEVAP